MQAPPFLQMCYTNHMKVRIEIDTKTFIRFWLVVFGFALLALAIYSARTALLILGIAFFLALALNEPVNWLVQKLPNKSRTLSTAIAFTTVVVVLGLVIVLVIPPIVQQTMKFVDNAPAMVETVAKQWHGIGELVEKYHVQAQVAQVTDSIQSDMTKWATSIGKNFLSGVGSMFAFFTAALLTLVLTFLMLVEGPTWLKRLWSLYQDEEKMKTHQTLVHRMRSVVTGYVGGQLSVSAIDGICAGLTVFILSLFFHEIPGNLAFPAILLCFVLSLIPMFGATVAGVLVSLLIAFNSIPAAIIFVVYFIVYQQLENNVISPKIQSKRIELSPLAVLCAVTVGLYVFGILGGIISIPVAGCLKVLADNYIEQTKKRRALKKKPLVKLAKTAKRLTGEEA